MKERPILFSAPMVRAIVDGRKTQTRRAVRGAPNRVLWQPVVLHGHGGWVDDHGRPVRCPYGQPGNGLWVREAWAPGDEMVFGASKDDPETVLYRADKAALYWDGKAMRTPLDTYAFNWDAVRWKPSIHMPRWASRIDLEITGVRVERLNDISEADAMAEGVERVIGRTGGVVYRTETDHRFNSIAGGAFALLWESINGHDSWNANPWVWVIEFKAVRR